MQRKKKKEKIPREKKKVLLYKQKFKSNHLIHDVRVKQNNLEI